MRPPAIRVHDLVVDNFAGGGGASLGIEWALGRSPDIAVNHDPKAIAIHEANHPATRHMCGDVWDVDPKEACAGRPVALAWFSPDCSHFSKAKGGKPVEKKIRGLAWVVIRWAKAVRPRVIVLENVEEFAGWGPLLEDGTPDPSKRGLTFRKWLGSLRSLGYVTDMRELRACDYGAPTSRKRLFIVARCDGETIVWPDASHGQTRSTPHRIAAECIEWSRPCPSIFDRARPLAEATLRRIGRGVWRYVIESADPFLIPVTHAGDDRVHSIREPMRTITAAQRGEYAFVSSTLIQQGWGERKGQAPRVPGIDVPLGTICAGGIKHAIVSAFLAKHFGGHETPGLSVRRPMSTITTQDHHALVWAPLVRADATHLGAIRSFLTKYNGTAVDGQSLQLPLGTVTTRDRFGLVSVLGAHYEIADIGMRMLEPRELFRAQGFPDDYRIDPELDGKPLSKTAQVRACGNSVCPQVAAAIVRANVSREESVAA